MKKSLFTVFAMVLSQCMFSQVGIGTPAPDSSSLLDLSASNKGFLPPRVALTGANDATTIPSPAKGLVAYNTNTAFASEGLYLNVGTSAAPDWRMLQVQRPGGTIIEYTSLEISPFIDLNGYPNADGFWREIPALRQNVSVSLGTNIKTVLTATLNAQSGAGTIAQADILVKVTPGTTSLSYAIPYNSSNPRDSFGLLTGDGNGKSVSINVAKSTVATATNYVVQVYVARSNSANNLPNFGISPAYINTLATK